MVYMSTTTFPRFNIDKPARVARIACDRCGGSGIFHTYGICYRCGGSKYDPTLDWGFPIGWTDDQIREWHAKRDEAARRRRQAKEAREQAKADQMFAANVERFPILATDCDHHIVRDIIAKAYRYEITERQAELVARIVGQEIERDAARKIAAATSDWIGEVGAKITVTGTVVTATTIEGYYGSQRLIVIDCDGNMVKSFTTAAWSWDVERDDTVTVQGTVKARDTYEGVKQTTITRGKRID